MHTSGEDADDSHSAGSEQKRKALLALAALGVVYGDIGTSPLYAVKEVFTNSFHPVALTPANILGVLSIMFWTLIIIVTCKYVLMVMRLDNKGEGGIMALLALVLRNAKGKFYEKFLVLAGMFGAALFYGDGIITPSISVLSAMEGIQVAAPSLEHFIIPLTVMVLILLFAAQKAGTSRVGRVFGPVVMVWFISLAALGIGGILRRPDILHAVNPSYAYEFLVHNSKIGFLALGAMVLAVTGAEALYADMSHFGRKPIQAAWFGVVLPSLVLNYFGQGALLLDTPEAVENPFYLLAPDWALFPLLGLATAATVIASQSVITGVFAVTHQAMQLGYVPRMEIQHTSRRNQGQIYISGVNRGMFWAVVLMVVLAGSSSRLASAYGIAVTGTMIITTTLSFFVVRYKWGWSKFRSCLVLLPFITLDLAYFSSCLAKLMEGGWIPLGLGVVLFFTMTTWKWGMEKLRSRLARDAMPLRLFVDSVGTGGVITVPGTAVYLTAQMGIVPHAMLHSLKHYKSLHEKIVVLTVVARDIPHVPDDEQIEIEKLSEQFYVIKVSHGFTDTVNLPDVLARLSVTGLSFDLMQTSFFLGRETIVPSHKNFINAWRQRYFISMFRNAGSAASHFHLPPNRVVEVGAQLEL